MKKTLAFRLFLLIVALQLSACGGGGGGGGGVVRPTPSGPTVTLAVSSSSISESSGSSLTLTATLSSTASADVTVTLATSGTATEGTDYSSISDITITAGSLTGTASFSPTDDSSFEGDETATVAIDTVSGGSATESGNQQVSITVAENETVTLSASSSSISEGSGSSITLTATISAAQSSDTTVVLSSSGTATEGTDYAALSDITISAGQTTGTTTFTPTHDLTYEGDQTATITISTAGGISVTNSSKAVSITLQEDEKLVFLEASRSSLTEDSVLTSVITARMTSTASHDVTVSLSTSGTATAGSDYSSFGNITIVAGATTGTVEIDPINDSIYEGSETVTVAIDSVSISSSAGVGVFESDEQTQTVTITDDDSAPTVTLTASTTTLLEKYAYSSTLTATASRVASSDIVVSLSLSGTATNSVDYSVSPSSITISAGSTTGTTSVLSHSDNVDEGGNETIIVDISSVTNGTESGTQKVTLTIVEYALDAGTQATYSSALAAAYETNSETLNIEALSSNAGSEPSPYQTIYLPEAFGYNKGGDGETIAIMDGGFYVSATGSSHSDLDGKSITVYGALSTPSSSNYHGTSVASVAAGDIGDGGIHGVAPLADLHLSDFNVAYNTAYMAQHWANATDDARTSGAVVQNNSWGIEYQADALQSYNSSNSKSAVEGFTDLLTSTGYTTSTATTQAYVTALNNFQDSGVIVFALSNDSTFTDADALAAMPAFFSELSEAWVTAVNINVTGSSYERKSAPCGQTAAYCLGADGYDITTAGIVSGGTSLHVNNIGTSFVAPQISGAIALLAEHFPNHTPEQLVDRLLATADNSFFTADGSVTFSNGVSHGYSTEYGHGVMNIYAALQPVTSATNQARVFSGAGSLSGASSSLSESVVRVSRSFGDSVARGLANETVIFYDALNGGFGIKASAFIAPTQNKIPTINVNSAMGLLGSISSSYDSIGVGLKNPTGVLHYFGGDEASSPMFLTFNDGTLGTQAFFGGASSPFGSLSGLQLPYLNQSEQGIGLNYVTSVGGVRLSAGSTAPVKRNDEDYYGDKRMHTAAIEYSAGGKEFVLISGMSQQNDELLGLSGSGAFDVEGSRSSTSFIGSRAGIKVAQKTGINLRMMVASTDYEGPSNSILTRANPISTAYSLSLDTSDIWDKDRLSLFATIPNQVVGGDATLRLSNLADRNGNLTYRERAVDLETSGRQLDMGITYQKKILNDGVIAIQYMRSEEPNHMKDAAPATSGFVGFGIKGFKAGVAVDQYTDTTSARINYSTNF